LSRKAPNLPEHGKILSREIDVGPITFILIVAAVLVWWQWQFGIGWTIRRWRGRNQ